MTLAVADDLLGSYSWPIYEAGVRMPYFTHAVPAGAPSDAQGIGRWSCRLEDNMLRWSPAIYELFGLPIDQPLSRSRTVSLYLPESRDAMEELRDYAIRHHRGFTLDARIRRQNGEERWMRLSTMPFVCERRVVRLIGTKQDVTAEYEEADTSGVIAQGH